MEAGPTTVRPSEPLDALIERMQKRRAASIVVSTAAGVLFGVLHRADGERRLSQQQLAEAMDVSRQTINSIEKERYTPSLPLAIALARYFGKTVEEVFDADS